MTTVEIVGTDHSEVVAAWLTTPPSTQMVWAVGRSVELEKDKQLPRPDVIASLRQKYGPNQVVPLRTWAFAINPFVETHPVAVGRMEDAEKVLEAVTRFSQPV